MISWQYEINDVLRITRKGQEVLARVAGYVDSLDNTKPLYVNLRRVGGHAGWRQTTVKVWLDQILEHLPNWESDLQAKYEAELKAHCDEMWAKMSDAQKERVHQQAMELGIGRDTRSPLDRMIDRACGLD